jgi:hypothetical protein
MSKRDLKKYLSELDKEQLEIQILELYDKFIPVKTYYNFVFNPKEDQLSQECKIKISNEYFPISGKKARARRSIAQKYIKHFITLGVDPFIIADIMLYSIEIAQTFAGDKIIKQESFYKSMLHSFEQVIRYMIENGILYEFHKRVMAINNETVSQNWINHTEFNAIVARLDY